MSDGNEPPSPSRFITNSEWAVLSLEEKQKWHADHARDEARQLAELLQSLVGRTILRAEHYDENLDDGWVGHEVTRLWLDDGRVIECGAYGCGDWGHDTWGATIKDVTDRAR